MRGLDWWHTYPIEQYNVPSVRMSDGLLEYAARSSFKVFRGLHCHVEQHWLPHGTKPCLERQASSLEKNVLQREYTAGLALLSTSHALHWEAETLRHTQKILI